MEAEQLPVGRESAQLRVRPLQRDDAKGIALLVADYFAEIGVHSAMSVAQMELLFATPWLDGGMGLIMEHGSDVAGYGFERPSRWKGKDTIQFGLTLRKGFRDRESHCIMTDPLLRAAIESARRQEIDNISIHLRGTDTVHAPVMLELGFQEHPVSMLGFRHDLAEIPSHGVPQGFSVRPARLPEESRILLDLLASAFDDRDRQGEPIDGSYLSFVAGKPGFDAEQVLLVESASGPVGGAIVDTPAARPGGSVNILEVGVLPDYRRRGIGSAMLCRVLEWLKARGAREARGGMFSSNLAAPMLWRLGFRPDPQQTFHFFVRDATALPESCPTGVVEAGV
jgi:GNAT superfamily N-acetyltransferase